MKKILLDNSDKGRTIYNVCTFIFNKVRSFERKMNWLECSKTTLCEYDDMRYSSYVYGRFTFTEATENTYVETLRLFGVEIKIYND